MIYIISNMNKNLRKISKSENEKTISYKEALQLVKSIQRKVEGINKNKSASTSSNGYSL